MTNKTVRILARQAQQYANEGYFVLQNNYTAHIQITDDGVHVKGGDSMAVLLIDSTAQKAIDRGLLKILARPSSQTATVSPELSDGKRAKKKSDDASKDDAIPVAAVDSPQPAETPSPTILAEDPAPSEVINENDIF